MKNIYFILFAIALFAFMPAKNVQAQTETEYKNGLGYSKNISTPDDKGIYTITLEAFTTGNVTVTKKSLPADIVLVLDISGSMNYDMNGYAPDNWRFDSNNIRLDALKKAVNGFIDIIDDNDLYFVGEDGKPDKSKPRDQRLGNRIAIVTYSTDANDRTNGLMPLGGGEKDDNGVTSLKATVSGLTATGGTYAHKGMNLAYGLLSPLPDTRQLRTTVFFTDGEPGLRGNWTESDYFYHPDIYAWPERQDYGNYQGTYYYYIRERVDTYNTANATIASANQIKGLADDSKGISSDVYTISIINNPSRQTRVYLGKTSSNWLGSTSMGNWQGTWNNDNTMWNNGNGSRNSETGFAMEADSQEALEDIFETIGASSGGSDADLGGSTVAVMDIVSANFMLPNGADPTQIKVYTAPCTGGTEGALTFGTPILRPGNQARYHKITRNPDQTITWSEEDYDVDEAIEVSIPDGEKMIQITGFDYASNFCGYDENDQPRGYKVLIEIPVKMDPDAVGGPNSDSNEPGSGIYADLDGDGSLDPVVTYDPPKVDLPTNIFIEKEGLKKGESAKFRIERIPKSNPQSTAWEPVTTIFLTNDVGEGHKPLVKIRGLDPNYIYQIVEEPWSWSYTPEAITATRTDQLITNPFKFKNTKKNNGNIDYEIRNAESKATNDFKGTGSVEFIDSKTNVRNSSKTPSTPSE